jgi:large subunit ribosomal protein L17
MLRNMATSLFLHGRIETTETKAKRLRPLAERLVSFAKRGDLAARRRVIAQLMDKTAVHKLFTEVAPLVADRPGGYTRITKLGFRKGDNAPMAVIELVLEPVSPKAVTKKPKVANAVKAAAAPAVVAEEAAVEEVVEETASDVAAEAVEATEAPAVVEEAPAAEDEAPAAEVEAEAPAVEEEAPVAEAEEVAEPTEDK